MSAKMTRFALPEEGEIAEEGECRLGRLVEHFGHGNRSALLREAIHQMEVLARAERLSQLQAYGVKRSVMAGLTHQDAADVVRRALSKR